MYCGQGHRGGQGSGSPQPPGWQLTQPLVTDGLPGLSPGAPTSSPGSHSNHKLSSWGPPSLPAVHWPRLPCSLRLPNLPSPGRQTFSLLRRSVCNLPICPQPDAALRIPLGPELACFRTSSQQRLLVSKELTGIPLPLHPASTPPPWALKHRANRMSGQAQERRSMQGALPGEGGQGPWGQDAQTQSQPTPLRAHSFLDLPLLELHMQMQENSETGSCPRAPLRRPPDSLAA